jgi:hypothetical protein
MPASGPRSGFRVLALSGGGYLGLYTAAVLAALEEEAGEPLGRRFERNGRSARSSNCSAATAPRCSRRARCPAGRWRGCST